MGITTFPSGTSQVVYRMAEIVSPLRRITSRTNESSKRAWRRDCAVSRKEPSEGSSSRIWDSSARRGSRYSGRVASWQRTHWETTVLQERGC